MGKVLKVSIVTAMLLFSGCGDDEGENRLNTQHLLDKGDWDGVISSLDAKYGPSIETNSTTISDEDALLYASSYMGKAGLNLSSMIDIITKSGDNDDDALASLLDGVSYKISDTALVDLKKASEYYLNVVGEETCSSDNITPLTDAQKDICLFMGLSETMKFATTMNYIAGDVTALFGDNTDGEDSKLQASTCAMQYAITGELGECTQDGISTSLHFQQSSTTYEKMTIISQGESFEYLFTQSTPKQTVITNGICTLEDFTTRVDDIDSLAYNLTSTYYVCPVNEISAQEEITTEEVLVDAINNGTESIGIAADEDMQEDINEFKKEILVDAGKMSADTSTENMPDVTAADIVAYLNENNE